MMTLDFEMGELRNGALRDLSPKPGQDISCEDGDSGARSDACQGAFRAWLPVRKLIPTNNDCD
jgi:hypothetical protein